MKNNKKEKAPNITKPMVKDSMIILLKLANNIKNLIGNMQTNRDLREY